MGPPSTGSPLWVPLPQALRALYCPLVQDGGGSDLLGRLGTVTLPVPGGERSGEVAVTLAGGWVERLLAVADGPLPVGAEVVVVAYLGPRRVQVESWSLGGVGPAGT